MSFRHSRQWERRPWGITASIISSTTSATPPVNGVPTSAASSSASSKAHTGAQLSRDNQIDQSLLRRRLNRELWESEQLQEWQWNPILYTQLCGDAIYGLLARDFAPIEARLASVTARLEQFPRVFEQIRVTPRIPSCPARPCRDRRQAEPRRPQYHRQHGAAADGAPWGRRSVATPAGDRDCDGGCRRPSAVAEGRTATAGPG